MTEGGSAHIVEEIFGMRVHLDTLIQVWSIMAIVLILAFLSTRNLKIKGICLPQLIGEMLYDRWFGQISSQSDEKSARNYLPFIGGIFCFMAFTYWSGLLPWKLAELLPFWPQVGTHKWEFLCPILDVNVPLAIALLSLLTYLYAGLKEGGISYLLAYLGISFHNGKFSISIQSVISGFVEWLDMITRPVTLTLRIFANVLAGEALTLTFISLSAVMPFLSGWLPLIIMFFEFGVGLIQAFIFSMLSTVYISMAVSHSKHNSESHNEAH